MAKPELIAEVIRQWIAATDNLPTRGYVAKQCEISLGQAHDEIVRWTARHARQVDVGIWELI